MNKVATMTAMLLFTQVTFAQTHPQIRLKTGFSLLFPSPGYRGWAYKRVDGTSYSVVLGGEFTHPFKNKKWNWHAGFVFQDGYTQPTPNERNLNPENLASSGWDFIIYGTPAKTVVYGGVERPFRDQQKLDKNYFSAIGGAGVSFTLNEFDPVPFYTPQLYHTWDGRVVEGLITNSIKPKFPIAPNLYLGLRYNFTNHKGTEVFVVEALYNYGLSAYFREYYDYKLDGVWQRDVVKEKGPNFQLNLVTPLVGFKKR